MEKTFYKKIAEIDLELKNYKLQKNQLSKAEKIVKLNKVKLKFKAFLKDVI